MTVSNDTRCGQQDPYGLILKNEHERFSLACGTHGLDTPEAVTGDGGMSLRFFAGIGGTAVVGAETVLRVPKCRAWAEG